MSPPKQARSVARLAVVQALYQMEAAGAGAETVIREFSEHRFDVDVDGVSLSGADETFFAELVRGVVAEQGQIDKAIVRRLADNWRLEHRFKPAMSAATRERKLAGWARAVKGVLASDEGE